MSILAWQDHMRNNMHFYSCPRYTEENRKDKHIISGLTCQDWLLAISFSETIDKRSHRRMNQNDKSSLFIILSPDSQGILAQGDNVPDLCHVSVHCVLCPVLSFSVQSWGHQHLFKPAVQQVVESQNSPHFVSCHCSTRWSTLSLHWLWTKSITDRKDGQKQLRHT